MGKGGGSAPQAPQVQIPAGLEGTIASTSGLGQYGSSLLDPLASMTNWAANLASGGNAGQIPSFSSTATQQGPQVSFGGSGNDLWNSSFDPTTGMITFVNNRAPHQSFQSALNASINPNQYGSFGDLSPSVIQQWTQDWENNQRKQTAGQASGSPGAGTGGLSPSGLDQAYTSASGVQLSGQEVQLLLGWPWAQQQDFLQKTGITQQELQSWQSQLKYGPFLGTAWGAIQAQQGLPSQMGPVEQQTLSLEQQATQQASDLYAKAGPMYDQAGNIINKGQGILDTGSGMLTEATTGSGLFPSQASYVEQAKQTGETEQAAMLAKLGLSESTMSPVLKEQADLAAAATAGTLIQGNIAAAQEEQKVGIAETGMGQAQLSLAQQQVQLSQASQKIAAGAQALELGEQQAVFDMWSSIASESVGFQKNLWDEALSGYGQLGNLIKTSADAYGYSLSGYQTVISAGIANAQNQTALDEAAIKADQSGTSSLFGALGSILGGGGGGGGGGSGIGSILGIVGGIVGSLFCWVAQTVYGADNPRWLQFRHWMLRDAPDWLFNWYAKHGERFAHFISDKPMAKWAVRLIMDMILLIDYA